MFASLLWPPKPRATELQSNWFFIFFINCSLVFLSPFTVFWSIEIIVGRDLCSFYFHLGQRGRMSFWTMYSVFVSIDFQETIWFSLFQFSQKNVFGMLFPICTTFSSSILFILNSSVWFRICKTWWAVHKLQFVSYFNLKTRENIIFVVCLVYFLWNLFQLLENLKERWAAECFSWSVFCFHRKRKRKKKYNFGYQMHADLVLSCPANCLIGTSKLERGLV